MQDFSIMQIKMVDLKGQYNKIKAEIDQAVNPVYPVPLSLMGQLLKNSN